MNLTINDELLEAGVLAVNLRKTDIGSGVREVDLYQILPGMIVRTHFLEWPFDLTVTIGSSEYILLSN